MFRPYQQLKNIYHFLQAHAWRLYYDRPDTALTLYGVTGTNGKTTTCFLIAGILAEHVGPEKVGMLTTITVQIGDNRAVNETKLTTLPSRHAYRYLKRMKDAGITHAVLELTSHSLDQHRLAGIRLDGAIILNIAREHLDYHRTMAAYAAAKAKIVDYLKPDAPLVAKKDDPVVYKTVSALRVTDYGLRLIWFTTQQAAGVDTKLPGNVNRENALAAALLMEAVGVPKQTVAAGIASVTAVPGRFEQVPNNHNLRIIIDYAVTPDALERLYQHVKQTTSGKVLAALGAAGRRDRGKRPDMASAVARYADVLAITREDPWTEDEEQIFHDLESGLTHPDPPLSGREYGAAQRPLDKGGSGGLRWRRIVDRKQALRWLLEQAKPGDTIVVTGKGAETGMGIGKQIVPYNERQTIEELLAEKS